ncbi:MAG: hypothetical protein ACKOAZ_07005 [Ilumatobacteraceae bacterium]
MGARMRRVAALPLAAALLAAASACSDDPDRSETAYCTAVGDNILALNSTAFADAVVVERVLAAWRDVAATAPLAVETEWRIVLAAMEQAVEVTPGDTEGLEAAADALRRAEPAADRVIDYTYRLCNAIIGPTPPVTTTPLQVPPTPPSTDAAATTAAP